MRSSTLAAFLTAAVVVMSGLTATAADPGSVSPVDMDDSESHQEIHEALGLHEHPENVDVPDTDNDAAAAVPADDDADADADADAAGDDQVELSVEAGADASRRRRRTTTRRKRVVRRRSTRRRRRRRRRRSSKKSVKASRTAARRARALARAKRARAAILRLRAKDMRENAMFRKMTWSVARKDPRFELAVRRRTRRFLTQYLTWFRNKYLLPHANNMKSVASQIASRRKQRSRAMSRRRRKRKSSKRRKSTKRRRTRRRSTRRRRRRRSSRRKRRRRTKRRTRRRRSTRRRRRRRRRSSRGRRNRGPNYSLAARRGPGAKMSRRRRGRASRSVDQRLYGSHGKVARFDPSRFSRSHKWGTPDNAGSTAGELTGARGPSSGKPQFTNVPPSAARYRGVIRDRVNMKNRYSLGGSKLDRLGPKGNIAASATPSFLASSSVSTGNGEFDALNDSDAGPASVDSPDSVSGAAPAKPDDAPVDLERM